MSVDASTVSVASATDFSTPMSSHSNASTSAAPAGRPSSLAKAALAACGSRIAATPKAQAWASGARAARQGMTGAHVEATLLTTDRTNVQRGIVWKFTGIGDEELDVLRLQPLEQ